jgi:hypothetical protein
LRIFTDLLRNRTLNQEHPQFPDNLNSQLAIFWEFFFILPKTQQQRILGTGKLPLIIESQLTKATKYHRRISEELHLRFNQENMNLVVENEFIGLKSKIFPVDIIVKDKKSGKILLFIELDGEKYHYLSGIGGERVLMRDDQLKTELYEYHYPDVPFKRVLFNQGGYIERYVDEIMYTIYGMMNRNRKRE